MSEPVFDVHLFTEVRLAVRRVPAPTAADALRFANEAVNFHEVIDRSGHWPLADNGATLTEIVWTEGALVCAQVDPLTAEGEVDYDASVWVDEDGNRLQEGQCDSERRLDLAAQAARFMAELLDSVESLSAIAQTHGLATLVDLTYLQHAILTGGFIDRHSEASRVTDVVAALPSSVTWLPFIRDRDGR
jgi:hypothetical protein